MKYFEEDIHIKTEGASEYKPRLVAYIPDNYDESGMNRIHPAVLILPGGAYAFTSERESEPIALKLVSEGVCAFVLYYSPAPAKFPQSLCEAFASIKYIREHAKEWNIDENNISVCGFSAGGHLCASVGVFWNNPLVKKYITFETEEIKPNKLILGYPVITSGEFAHRGSINNLLGENKTKESIEFVSLEKQVTKDVPSTFIWHTYEDKTVPVQNTMLFAQALLENDVPLEMHIYRRGGHGLSLGNFLVNREMKFGQRHMSSDWIDKAIRFIFD